MAGFINDAKNYHNPDGGIFIIGGPALVAAAADADIPAPGSGFVVYHSSTLGDVATKGSSGTVRALPRLNAVCNSTTKNLGIVEPGAVPLGNVTTGTRNTIFGVGAGASITTARNNVAFGDGALAALSVDQASGEGGGAPSYETAIGSGTMAKTLGHWNTGVGYEVLKENTTGYGNTSCGVHSMMTNVDGYDNTAYGFDSLLFNVSGWGNVCVGYNTGRLVTGNSNTFVGAAAGNNCTGNSCVGIGNAALISSTADNNVAVGPSAMTSCTTGQRNTAVGGIALGSIVGGCDYMTAIGYSSGGGDSGGYCNTHIGANATVATNGVTNATSVGYGALVRASNCVQLGQASSVKTFGFGAATLYLRTATPEGAQTGNIGDEAIDTINGVKYLKVTDAGTNTGWKAYTMAT